MQEEPKEEEMEPRFFLPLHPLSLPLLHFPLLLLPSVSWGFVGAGMEAMTSAMGAMAR